MRRLRSILFILLFIAAATAVLFAGGAPEALLGGGAPAELCGGSDHTISVDRPLVWRGPVELSHPCRLLVRRGGSVILDGAQLRGSHLYIADDDANGATRVEVRGSRLVGPDAAFAVDLRDADDELMVIDSQIDFDHGAMATIGGPDSGGRLRVERSRLRSYGAESQGIALMAGEFGGHAEVRDSVFEVPAETPAFVFAGTCVNERTQGIPPRCSP